MAGHSIFNDVLDPIIAGPSSSHSAGCARIGRMTRLLWGKEIKKAVVVYDSQGSYPSTCVGQGSNFGFTGGLLGFKNDDPRMKNSQEIARDMGVDISFSQEILSQRHPNEARIDIYDEDGEVGLSVLTFSTGGGMFEIIEMDGFPIPMKTDIQPVFSTAAEAIEYAASNNENEMWKLSLDKAMMYALSVMENSCAHNIVVAAPTAGSSGVIPAELRCTCKGGFVQRKRQKSLSTRNFYKWVLK